MKNSNDIIKKLKSCGITPTSQRVEIAQILFARPQHLSAEQVLKTVNKTLPVASKATIYNTLGLFAEKGLIRAVIVDPSKVFYDSNVSEHFHFYNMDTGELTDIPAEQVQFSRLPELPDDMVSGGLDVIVRIRNR